MAAVPPAHCGLDPHSVAAPACMPDPVRYEPHSLTRLVALASSVQQPAPQQCERVLGAMQRLRALGAGALLGCSLQQALDSRRG